ncbi:MAG TPA: VanZ family protein [Anaeromyxobacteraceae bacterium]|nr:VanZ family protein [Anaeromyxobacteraceae bacterium]
MNRGRFVAWAPVLLYALLIFALSSLARPQDLVPPELLSHDKLIHFAEYTVLGGLLARALRAGGRPPVRAFAVALLLGALYGASDELHLAFVPGRDASPLDWAADAGGTALGAVAVLFLRRRGGAD